MRYFVYGKYIRVFQYIRNHDNFYKGFVLEEKFGKRGIEAKSIIESRGGIINNISFWTKKIYIIDSLIIEYENKKSQLLCDFTTITISLCTLAVTIATFYLAFIKI